MQKLEKISIGDEGLFKVFTDKGVFYCHDFVDYDYLVSFDHCKVLDIVKVY